MERIGAIEIRHDRGTALPQPSTDALDLTALPERLDDAMLARVQDIAVSPLPDPTPCDERHLNQCLRVMLAVLPRQAANELSGELFVAAYAKKLGHLPKDAVSYLADKAMERCRWFPTISECLDFAREWKRDDEHTRRKALAARLAVAERNARDRDYNRVRSYCWRSPKISQAEIDQMSPELIELGLSCKTLRRNADGKVVEWFDNPADEPGPFDCASAQ